MSHLNVVGMDERGRPMCKHSRLRHGCPDCKEELSQTKRMQIWRTTNPDKSHEAGIRQYGVNTEWYAEQYARQRGLCAICGKPETSKCNGSVRRLAVDHNHATDEVRELICYRCNVQLAVIEDMIWRAKAEAYLARTSQGLRPVAIFAETKGLYV